ncbi:polysaccharide biosynthesis protein, partial [Pediococcus pentosaceus]
ALQKRDTKAFYRSATSLLRVSLTISMAASIGMVALMPQINHLLFGSSEGSLALAVYNLSVIFAALIFVYNSILQSAGAVKPTLVAIITGIIIKVVLNSWATQWLGILGASLVTVLSLAVIAGVMNYALPSQLSKRVYREHHFLRKLIWGNLLMFIVVKLLVIVLQLTVVSPGRFGATIITVMGVIVGAGVFISYIFKFRLFSIREWLTIPYGSKILRMVQRIVK